MVYVPLQLHRLPRALSRRSDLPAKSLQRIPRHVLQLFPAGNKESKQYPQGVATRTWPPDPEVLQLSE